MKRLLTLKETAELLQVNERTALRLAHAGTLPATRVGGQWRVDPIELERWFLESRRAPEDEPEEAQPSLFAEERVVLGLRAGAVSDVLRAIAANLAECGQLIYPDLYERALREREDMMSTGIGEGVAIPHARHAVNGLFRHPLCVFLRLEQPIDFKAVDGKPVDLVFALAAPTNAGHLRSLASLLRIARDPALRDGLRAAPDAAAALALLREAAR